LSQQERSTSLFLDSGSYNNTLHPNLEYRWLIFLKKSYELLFNLIFWSVNLHFDACDCVLHKKIKQVWLWGERRGGWACILLRTFREC
jgi:hypothetical protein